MDDDYRELANRLFAIATAILEDVIEVAVAGQSPRLNPSQLADHGHRLQVAAQDIAIIADAAMVIARLGQENAGNSLRKRSH